MSRIGNKPVKLLSGVTMSISADKLSFKSTKGELSIDILPGIKVEQKEDEIVVSRSNDERQTRAFHGLIRSMIQNHIEGLTKGYRKTLKMVGTGYRVTAKGKGLSLTVGFSHPVEVTPAEGINLTVEGNDTIHIDGIDKQAVGQMAANIRKIKPPEPYKGKGIRYEDEVVRKKAGKTAA